MVIHKLYNGDVIKILPIINKDRTQELFKKFHFIFINNRMICDVDFKKVRRIFDKYKSKYKDSSVSYMTRYFYCVYVNNEIKFIRVGNSLNNIISKDIYKIMDIKEPHNIVIDLEMKNAGGMMLQSYEKSTIVKEISTSFPKGNIEEYIIKNQPMYLEDYINGLSIENNKKLFDSDILSEIVQEDRNTKLNLILT